MSKMNKLNDEQVEKLINIIKEKPIIYNKADKYYKYVSMKERIWKSISESVGADGEDCKLAWKSLRDQFVKATKRTNGKKAYKYYDQLSFLKDTIQTRKKAPSCNYFSDGSEAMDSDTAGTLDEPEYVEVKMNENKPSAPKIIFSKDFKKRSPKEDDCMKKFLSEIIGEIKSANTVPDENEGFFSNLASMVSRANLTPMETRQLQRTIFNVTVDELDKIEKNK